MCVTTVVDVYPRLWAQATITCITGCGAYTIAMYSSAVAFMRDLSFGVVPGTMSYGLESNGNITGPGGFWDL